MTALDRTDEDLAVAAQAGDKEAFAALYDRYLTPVHDFLVRFTRNRELAADVAQDTFIRAMQRLDQLREPSRVRAWLFAIARSQALNSMEKDRRSTATDPLGEPDDAPTVIAAAIDEDRFSDPEEAAAAADVAALVWEAAESLDERTYAVLDLTVRQGLSSPEVAEVLGVTKGNAAVMVNRMKDRAAGAITTYLHVRGASDTCDRLGELVAGEPIPPVSAELRQSVDRHVRGCEPCSEHRRRAIAPQQVLAAFAAETLPAGLAESTWAEIDRRWDTEGPGAKPARWPRLAAGVGALILAMALLVLPAALAPGGPGPAGGDGTAAPGAAAPLDPDEPDTLGVATTTTTTTTTTIPTDGSTTTTTTMPATTTTAAADESTTTTTNTTAGQSTTTTTPAATSPPSTATSTTTTTPPSTATSTTTTTAPTTTAPPACPDAGPVPPEATSVSSIPIVIDGPGDVLTVYASGGAWRVHVAFAAGGSSDADLGEFAGEALVLGARDIDGDGRQEGFVKVGVSDGLPLVGLVSAPGCDVARLGTATPFDAFPIGTNEPLRFGLACTGSPDLTAFAAAVGGGGYTGSLTPYDVAGGSLDAGSPVFDSWTSGEAAALAVLDCPGVPQP